MVGDQPYSGIGVGFWIIGIPVALMMRRRPEDYGQLPDGDAELRVADANGGTRRPVREISIGVREVLRLRAFWQISIAVSVGQLVSSTNLFHLPALSRVRNQRMARRNRRWCRRYRGHLGSCQHGLHRRSLRQEGSPNPLLSRPNARRRRPCTDQSHLPRYRLGAHPATDIRPRFRARLWRIHPAPTRDPRRLLRTTVLRFSRRHRKLCQRHLRHYRAAICRPHVRLHRFLPTGLRHHGPHDANRYTHDHDPRIPN